MGKKTKVGKQRKDKFYHLAKETGYRSRAAFKLIQLNRKFEFLQKSKVLVDLCAAPGGWMQVAVEHMPVGSVIVGVDLFPIKPVSGCIGIQEDITTPRCLQLLRKELKTWKADVVLHDGAPNVGQNWLHDAYSQSCLTLSAFKLATDLLRPGGFFVTKVFRSKDYNSLVWVLQQFFKNVFSTKPAASRAESAEIFVVCKGYLAPSTIDPKFLDPKFVFEDIEVPESGKQLLHLLQGVGKKKKADGYPTGEALLYRPIKASDFIQSTDHIELLANTSQIIIDEEWISKSEKTTQDIKHHCEDVKVLGRKEIRQLIHWRKALREKLDQFAKLKSETKNEVTEIGSTQEMEIEEDSEEETNKLDRVIEELKQAEEREAKKKKKKLLKERRKVHEKTNLKMILPGDAGPTDTQEDLLFSLKSVRSKNDVENLTDGSKMPEVQQEPELTFEEELKQHMEKSRAKRVSFNKEKEMLDSSGRYYRKIDDAEEVEPESEDEDEPDLDKGLGFEKKKIKKIAMDESDEDLSDSGDLDMEEVAPIDSHPLITDLDHSSKDQKRLRKAQMWFDKSIFEGLEDDSDEDAELDRVSESFVRKGVQVIGYQGKTEPAKPTSQKKADVNLSESKKRKQKEADDFENVGAAPKSNKKVKLDIKGMALGTLMVQSQKNKRDLMDDGWNKYAFNDTGLPEWFVDDEKKHNRKPLPVPSSLVDEYKNSLTEINARPIKKVAEAKARKKKRAIRKLEKAKKKAEQILDKGDMTETEKANQIRQVYKKAMTTKKKEVTYVVAKKFNTGKRAKRPAGVKGSYKVVDPRMKKDLRAMKAVAKKKGGKSGKGKPSRGAPGRGKARGRK
ncbi:unnamed protein product [Allacma fusca]|uniref:Putative rRNA methyltransferase n=1 Tax=Allacma fusca TaxID=39272 RepID=A0A8J2KWN5_9HEXA|nr:unnamed protein product [Allacma fusca]